MKVGRIDYSAWFFRLMTWDGVLPVILGLAPLAVELLIPNHRGVMEITAVALPVAAFMMRFGVGLRIIRTNNCVEKTRQFQVVALVFGMVMLLFFEAVSILTHVMPSGALFATWLDFLSFMVVFGAVYLAAMAVALYPGPVWRLDFSRAWRL